MKSETRRQIRYGYRPDVYYISFSHQLCNPSYSCILFRFLSNSFLSFSLSLLLNFLSIVFFSPFFFLSLFLILFNCSPLTRESHRSIRRLPRSFLPSPPKPSLFVAFVFVQFYYIIPCMMFSRSRSV